MANAMERLFDLCKINLRHASAVTARDEWSAEKAYLATQCGLRGYIGGDTGRIDFQLCDYVLAVSKAGRNLRAEYEGRRARKAMRAAAKEGRA